jgi:hypothetical protein
MLVRLSRPSDLDAFCNFLEAVRVRAIADGHGFLTVSLRAVTPKYEERQLRHYVDTWNQLHPDRRVEVLT